MDAIRRKVPSRVLAMLCAALCVSGEFRLRAQPDWSGQSAPEKLLSGQQLESLVAPVALFPDPLLGQFLAACTYPLQAVEADRWLLANQKLKGEKLVQAAAQQDWEPSIQALVVFPDQLRRISDNLKWATALGNAFLAQQEDVMNAVQALRRRAQQAGKLHSNAQQKIDVQNGNIIVIQPADRQVMYVPNYDPAIVYGALAYPYPAMAYPAAAGPISFGTGAAVGAVFGFPGWGWGCDWRRGSVTVDNNFLSRYGYRGATGTGAWAHNPHDREGVPYSSARVADRYRTGGVDAARTAVTTPRGSVSRMAEPNAPAAVKTPSSGEYAGSRDMSSRPEAPRSAFESSGASATHANSNRGHASMSGRSGGGR
jgi:hypothetical protein